MTPPPPQSATEAMARAIYEHHAGPGIDWVLLTEDAMTKLAHMARAQAALTALCALHPGIGAIIEGGDGWQDISTAPKDGTHVLVSDSDGAVFEARWLDQTEEWWRPNNDPTDHWGEAILATHWQPLPPPPAPAAVEADGAK